MSAMTIYDGFGYAGGKFQVIYQDTIGFLAGNALCLWNLESGKKEYIQSSKNGFQCFCSHFKRQLIVIAEYGLNPFVYVYRYPGKELLLTLQGVSQLEIIQMDISCDGLQLLVVSGVPKYEISIWNLNPQNPTRFEGNFSTIPLKLNYETGFFSQLHTNKFYLLYQKNLILYEMVPFYEKSTEEDTVIKKIKLEQIATYPTEGSKQFIVQDYLSDLDTEDKVEANNLYLIQDNKIIYLSGNELKEIEKYQCPQTVKHLLVTQKHIIVIFEDGLLQWMFKYIPVNKDDNQRKPFKYDGWYKYSESNISVSQIMYNHTFTKIIAAMSDSSIYTLPYPAQSSMEDEEDENQAKDHNEDQQEEQENKQIEVDPVKLGPYQKGALRFIREMKSVLVVITGCESGKILFWDIFKRDVLCSFTVKGNIISGDLSLNDQILVVGTSQGVIRYFNIADIRKPVLLKIMKLFKGKPISQILFNPDNSLIAVSSIDSPKLDKFLLLFYLNRIYFIGVEQLNLIGYVTLPATCSGITWNNSSKQVVNSAGAPMLFAITYFLLIGVTPPEVNQSYDNLKLSADNCPLFGRKIDPDQQLITMNPSVGELLTTGKDKVFKKYKQPEELLSKMDLKVKVASQGPMDEQDGHQLPATSFAIHTKQLILYSGAQDGSIISRSSERIGQDIQIFKGHNLMEGGVCSLEVSYKARMLYSGGFKGEFYWWCQGKIKFDDSDAEKVMKNVFDVPDGVDDQDDDQVKHYQQVLEEEYMESQAPIREQQKREKKDLLRSIKEQLYSLIESNGQVDELEQLSRDDFVIDVFARDEILENGRKQKSQLREKVKRENYRQEILHGLIKERTWDKMEVPLRAINGLNSNIIVPNFHIRIRGAEELRKLQLVKEFRRQELKEKQLRKDKKTSEIWQIEDHITDPKAYIVNAIPGPFQMVLTDYEKKEEPAQIQAKGVQKGGQPIKNARAQGGKAAAMKAQQQQEQKKEDEKKEEEKQKEAIPKLEEKKEGEEFSDWEFLYGSFELFTNNRKRNQIVLLHNIIFKIKREFNKEFESAMQLRQTQVDNIIEKNKRIAEILTDLKKPIDLFQPKKNILENPDSVLNVDLKEIPFERYLTKEEREKREQERLKEEERIRALMQDDAGQRAIKDMMGGTLEEKKETPLDEKLEEEEWMKKPFEEMNEEERMKIKEYEVKKQRLEEEKEKIRKNLENELKKLKNEILEICSRFDERLLILFRRKLEYDYRIFEQELYIIRLALSIIQQNDSTVKTKVLKTLIDELDKKATEAKQMKEQLEALKIEISNQKSRLSDQIGQTFQRNPSYVFDTQKIKQVWLYAFEDLKKDDKKRKQDDKKLLAEQEYKDLLIPVDPLFELEKKQLKKKREAVFDNYLFDIQEKISNMQLFDWNEKNNRDYTMQQLQSRFQLKRELERTEQELNDLERFMTVQFQELEKLQKKFGQSADNYEEIELLSQKSKSNIEVMLRFKQGLVEISQDRPVPNLFEAILIPREAIDKKNDEIKKQGDEKIRLMDKVKEIKFAVAKSEYELKSSDLIIRDLECKTREVQLLKVKKEMYAALKKKDTRLNEQELQNLQNQIDMLRQATDKRIMIYQKKEEKIKKDIEFIMKENEQLLNQGANLNTSVKRLQEISDMTFKKKTAQQQQGAVDEKTDNAAYEKFSQIAANRKYFDLAKKQTEEIELLREELNKLKARTFANFTNVNK